MKAIVYHNYGAPREVLAVEEIEKPTPGEDEVLVKVRAAAGNPMDYHLMSGMYVLRPMTGFRKPKRTRPGVDFAGEVEAVGKNVRLFKQGDTVFGVARGAFAEYVCALENKLALKPANATFEQAAAIPVAGSTALQALRDKGRIQPGHKVLVNGAAGGVGTFAVQIAKSFGAEVTGVCSTRNLELVRSLGADHAIDYTSEDFTRSNERYDVMLDCVGNRSVSACLGVLAPKGTFVGAGLMSGGSLIRPIVHLLNLLVFSWFARQRVVIVSGRISTEDLTVLKELIEANKVTPTIDRRYMLSGVPQAIQYLKEGHARGKVVITVEQNEGIALARELGT
jgi:NADPH:quinone reductase-like Zn-dependent oxidoreductase